MPAAEYRKYAEECSMRAAAATSPDHQRQYQELADEWLKLARSAERSEKRPDKETPSAS
jgi:hypothetical protein